MMYVCLPIISAPEESFELILPLMERWLRLTDNLIQRNFALVMLFEGNHSICCYYSSWDYDIFNYFLTYLLPISSSNEEVSRYLLQTKE